MTDSIKTGHFIMNKRKALGLTQQQLAAKLHVSYQAVSKWETGNYMPDLSLLEPLSKELEISLNELLTGEEIEQEKVIEYTEQNLLSTIDYTGEIYSLAGLLLMVAGIFRELNFSSIWKKGLVSAGIFIVLLGVFFVADYIGVMQFKQPPIY